MSQKLLSKVSIILPTYNGEKYIRESIDSCLGQTYKNIELIIVDDGSTDRISKIIKSYKDKRIKYIKHKKNKGLPCALNTGFANASGEYLTWTSDDNYYHKKAIEKMLFLLRDKRCDFVYCDFYRFNNDNSADLNIVKLPDTPVLKKNNDIGACFSYSNKVKKAIGNYDPETNLAEDYDYWIRVSKKFPMYHLNKSLYFFREHKNSLSSRFLKQYDIQIISILVRIKNNIINIEPAADFFINLIIQKYPGYFRIKKVVIKILFVKKINKILRNFQLKKISFKNAKIKLKNIINKKLI